MALDHHYKYRHCALGMNRHYSDAGAMIQITILFPFKHAMIIHMTLE